MKLPWKPRYQNNEVGWRPLLLCNGNSSYVTPNAVGWRIAILRFFFIIIIIIIILPHIFVHSISRRCLDQTLWNLVGISYAMSSCAGKGWFFQNDCRCHGNGQNAKKMKNTKIIIAGYSPNRNWWNLIGTTSTWISQKNRNRLDKLCRSCHGNEKGGIKKKIGFLSSNFIKLCRNIHRSVWKLLACC